MRSYKPLENVYLKCNFPKFEVVCKCGKQSSRYLVHVVPNLLLPQLVEEEGAEG